MRKIPIEFARDGDVLARSIYNNFGGMLLREGFVLEQSVINRLKSYGYLSIYIKDRYTERDIEEIIKPQMMSKIHNVYNDLRKILSEYSSDNSKIDSKKVENKMEDLSIIMEEIFNDIINSNQVVENLASISVYDDYTLMHSLNMMMLSVVIAKDAKFNMSEIKQLSMGCVFHDIGKTFLPIEVINKPGKLTNEEYEIIKQHPQIGYNFLKEFTELPLSARNISLSHHERVGGSGYPRSLKDDEIHKFCKVAAISDVFDALISDRPYRRAIPIHEAREYILGGSRHFDINYIRVFSRSINPFPKDTLVYLSDGREGIVYEVRKDIFTRPEVKIYGEKGKEVNPYFLDLRENNDIVIEKVIHIFSFNQQK